MGFQAVEIMRTARAHLVSLDAFQLLRNTVDLSKYLYHLIDLTDYTSPFAISGGQQFLDLCDQFVTTYLIKYATASNIKMVQEFTAPVVYQLFKLMDVF